MRGPGGAPTGGAGGRGRRLRLLSALREAGAGVGPAGGRAAPDVPAVRGGPPRRLRPADLRRHEGRHRPPAGTGRNRRTRSWTPYRQAYGPAILSDYQPGGPAVILPWALVGLGLPTRRARLALAGSVPEAARHLRPGPGRRAGGVAAGRMSSPPSFWWPRCPSCSGRFCGRQIPRRRAGAGSRSRDLLFHRVEELELGLASARIDHGEAARRLAGADDGDGMRAVEAVGLRQRYGTRTVLGPLDLVIEAGESLAVLGENGSGKTTLLRLLATAARPVAGRPPDPWASTRPSGPSSGDGSGLGDSPGLSGAPARPRTWSSRAPRRALAGRSHPGAGRAGRGGRQAGGRALARHGPAARPRPRHPPRARAAGARRARRRPRRGGPAVPPASSGGRSLVLATHDRDLAAKLCGRSLDSLRRPARGLRGMREYLRVVAAVAGKDLKTERAAPRYCLPTGAVRRPRRC